MPLDYTHEHLSSQIMRDGEPRAPIDPSGGEQNIRLLGPFVVAADTDTGTGTFGGDGATVTVTEIEAPCWIINSWAYVDQVFDGDFPADGGVVIKLRRGPGTTDVSGYWQVVSQPSVDGVWLGSALIAPSVVGAQVGDLVQAVLDYPNDPPAGPSTEGQVSLYVLVAEPA